MARKSGTIVLITIFMRKKAGNFISSLALIQNSHCNLEKTNLANRNAVSVCGKNVSRNLKSNQPDRWSWANENQRDNCRWLPAKTKPNSPHFLGCLWYFAFPIRIHGMLPFTALNYFTTALCSLQLKLVHFSLLFTEAALFLSAS